MEMNNAFIYGGWNRSKNDNLYKIIDGELYTIGQYGREFTVYTDGCKPIRGLSSLIEAKEVIFELAYGNYDTGSNEDNEYFDNPMFKEIVKQGYRQLSKKYHPDIVGGSADKMKALNRLYEELKAKI